MKFFSLIILALSISCGGTTFIVPNPDGGEPSKVECKIFGRGCCATTVNKDGSFDIVMQQDASSDWAGTRAIPVLAWTAITAMFGDRSYGAGAEMQGPSDIQGCSGIFETIDKLDEEDEENEN